MTRQKTSFSLRLSNKYVIIFLFFSLCIVSKTKAQTLSFSHNERSLAQVVMSQDETLTTQRGDNNSLFSIFVQTVWAQIKDPTFYAALIIGFMYTPAFAFTSYFFACFVTTVIGLAFADDLLSVVSSLVTGIVTAILYSLFSLLTMFFIYTMKDPQVAIEAKPEEREDFNNYSNLEEGESLIPGRSVVTEPPKKRSFCAKYFSFEFFSTQLGRFLFAVAMLFVSELAGSILSNLLELRAVNSSSRVFLGALIAYLLGVAIIFGIGYFIKKFLLQKLLNINTDHVKMTKYLGCVVLLLVGIVPLIVTIKERQQQ